VVEDKEKGENDGEKREKEENCGRKNKKVTPNIVNIHLSSHFRIESLMRIYEKF